MKLMSPQISKQIKPKRVEARQQFCFTIVRTNTTQFSLTATKMGRENAFVPSKSRAFFCSEFFNKKQAHSRLNWTLKYSSHLLKKFFSIILYTKLLIFVSFLGDCKENFVGNSNASAYRTFFSGNDGQQTSGTRIVCV